MILFICNRIDENILVSFENNNFKLLEG